MPQLVWLEGKHATQSAHCALVGDLQENSLQRRSFHIVNLPSLPIDAGRYIETNQYTFSIFRESSQIDILKRWRGFSFKFVLTFINLSGAPPHKLCEMSCVQG